MNSEIRKCDDTFVMVLPQEVVDHLGWSVGDILGLAVEGGSLTVRRTQTAHDHALEIARDVMTKHHKVFEALAKT